MTELYRWPLRLLVIGVIVVAIGSFADTPSYTNFPADQALIRLSFSHGGGRPDCHRRTAEELAALPANMRAPMDCPRGRLPVTVELDLDGSPLFSAEIEASGLQGDGPSRVYEGFVVAPGTYEIEARLRDSDRSEGFDYVEAATLSLEPRQNLVIEFESNAGGFVFH